MSNEFNNRGQFEEENKGTMDETKRDYSTYYSYRPEVITVEEKPKKKHRFLKGMACVLAFGLVAGASFGTVYVLHQGTSFLEGSNTNNSENKDASSESVLNDQSSIKIVETNAVSDTSVNDVSGVVKEVMPSIVSINCTSTVTSNYFGQSVESEAQSSGSGIIIGQNDNQVLIVTNNHVVADTAAVEVQFVDETTATAEIKGTDSSNDLAVIAVNVSDLSSDTQSSIRIAQLGDSDEVEAGEMVIAIGNALGYGQSVTVGYVSALNREVVTEDYTMSLLQTDAAINPGNSGGALLNASGQVIGINSVKYSSTEVEGIGYAIPISYAVPIINDLSTREAIPEDEQAYLGVYTTEISEAVSEKYNMPVGVYVQQVTSGSPADEGGLQKGDIITEFDGTTVGTMTALQEQLSANRAGTKVTVKVQRFKNNKYVEKKLTITLGSKSEASSSQSESQIQP